MHRSSSKTKSKCDCISFESRFALSFQSLYFYMCPKKDLSNDLRPSYHYALIELYVAFLFNRICSTWILQDWKLLSQAKQNV